MIKLRTVCAIFVVLLSSLSMALPAAGSEADSVSKEAVPSTASSGTGGTGTKAADNPAAPQQDYDELVAKQLDAISTLPRVTAQPGGPSNGPASADALRGADLPAAVVSMWPSPGAELLFPNREYRVSFRNQVDSRTFRGRILEAGTGKVAVGLDGTPALFTRSARTETEAVDVIGSYPALGPGEYEIEFSVTLIGGEEIKATVPFSQLQPIVAPGGGNHRHGDLRMPFEKELTTTARGLIVLAFALLFRRRNSFVLPASLGVAGAIYLGSFLVTASDTILTSAELFGRLDGWAAGGMLAAAVTAALARRTGERVAATVFAALCALATTYLPFMQLSAVLMAILVGAMLAAGRFAASVLGWREASAVRTLAYGVAAAFLPVVATIVSSGSLTPERGMAADFRDRLLAAAIVLAATAIGLALQKILPPHRFKHIPIGLMVSVVAAGVAIATTAPQLL